MKTACRALLLCGAAGAVLVAGAAPAQAAYPFKCQDNKVLKVDRTTGATSVFTTIQGAVNAATGSPAGSGAGDTVIVCHGTFNENVTVSGATKQNVTIRSGDGADKAKVIGSAAGAVFDIDAPGVTLGGPGLGLTITGAAPIGVQVGDPMEPDPDQDDDQPGPCPPPANPLSPTECPDKEIDPFPTTNVSIVGNRIVDLSGPGSRAGISVTNTNNTMTFRNLVKNISSAGGDAYGIRYSDSNYGVDIHQNRVEDISQTGVACGGSTLASPTVGAIGVAVAEEALDASILDTLVEDVTSPCIAIGAYSDAWGGLENDRNGQQIPIVTDLVDNRIKKIKSTGAGNSHAGIVIAPNPLESDDEDTNPPSSFRVLANDLDDTKVAIAVLTQMATSSYIRENDLDAADIGVLNAGNSNLDATNNWWGCQEGPASGKDECATIVNSGGTTVFNPWLKRHVDHAGAHAGEYAGHG